MDKLLGLSPACTLAVAVLFQLPLMGPKGETGEQCRSIRSSPQERLPPQTETM
jgi:hypothetical protein